MIRIIFLAFVIRTVSYLELHCSLMLKVLRFEIFDESWFLVFGVPNAKYLTFGTLDSNALTQIIVELDVEVVVDLVLSKNNSNRAYSPLLPANQGQPCVSGSK